MLFSRTLSSMNPLCLQCVCMQLYNSLHKKHIGGSPTQTVANVCIYVKLESAFGINIYKDKHVNFAQAAAD